MEGRESRRERALYPPAVHILIPISSPQAWYFVRPMLQPHGQFKASAALSRRFILCSLPLGEAGGRVLEVTHSQSSPTCEKLGHGAEGANEICHPLHLRPELWSLRNPQAFGGPQAWSLRAPAISVCSPDCTRYCPSCLEPHWSAGLCLQG